MLLREDDDPTLAKKHFFKALEINPEYAVAFYELAHHSEKNGDINEAKIHFQKATDVDQNYVDAYFNLARILKSPSEHDQAVRNYETAIEIKSDMADSHYWFAKLLTTGERLSNDGTLLKEPKLDEAEKHFKHAIRIDPKFAKAFYRLGILLYEKKEYTTALYNFEQAIKLDPKFPKAHYSLAILLMNKDARNALEKDPQPKSKKSIRGNEKTNKANKKT